MCKKLLFNFSMIVFIIIIGTAAFAQNIESIPIINQYYHNWLDGVEDVYIDGNLAYLACGNDGLRIVNIGNLDAIYDLGQFSIPGAYSVTVADDYAFVGTGAEGWYIIDISEPESMVEVFYDDAYYLINEVEIVDNSAFLCHNDGITIVDITDISNPVTLWTSIDISYGTAIEIRDNIAYLGSGSPGLVVMDIADQSSPEILYTYQPSGDNYVNGLDIQGNYAYLASDWNGFEVFDLTTQERVATIDTLASAFRLEVEGDYAYMTYGNPECPFAIVDISNPLSPQTLGIYYPPEDLINFAIAENYAFMADFCYGLRVVDVSIPETPVETYVYSRYGEDIDVVVQGDYAYIREDIKFKIVDISDMTNPFETGYYEFDWGFNDINIVGDIAYLSKHSHNCLYSFDISDPYNPQLLDTYNDEDTEVHYYAELYGNYAYISSNSGLEIVDISNPEDITYAGNYCEDIGSALLEIYDHYLFLSGNDSNGNIKVYDLTDPLSPEFLNGCDLGNRVYQIKAVDGYLYVMGYRKMWVFDLSNLNQWEPVSEAEMLDDRRYWTDMVIEGETAYLTNSTEGLLVYDISDFNNPVLMGNAITPGDAEGLFVRDGIAFIADNTNLGFYDCTSLTGVDWESSTLPESFALVSSYPNPFNASTNVMLELATSAKVKLEVFDILGRKVNTLADREFEAGRHTINWNGTNGSGQPAASGRYYIKAVSDSQVTSISVTLLK